MPIIQHDPSDEYRVDIIAGNKQTGSHYFTAADSEVTDTARRIVVSLGGDTGDIYQNDGTDYAIYYDSVVVE